MPEITPQYCCGLVGDVPFARSRRRCRQTPDAPVSKPLSEFHVSIINFSHNFLFVHVPKSAGTSVTRVLSTLTSLGDIEIGGTEFGETLARAYGPRFGVEKHSTAAELRRVTGDELWVRLYKFAFVRNPYARAFSVYTFLKTKFRQWRGSEVMDGFEDFDAFIASDFFLTDGPDRLLRPQLFWLRTSPDDETLLVDFVGHVESIGPDLALIMTKVSPGAVGPVGKAVPRVNASAQPEAWRTAYVSEATRARVAQRYARDFAKFGYSTDFAQSGSS